MPRFRATPNLSHYRATHGWTQQDLARRIEVNPSYWSTMENGRRALGPKGATKIARALGMSLKKALELELFAYEEATTNGRRAARTRSA